MVGAPQQDGHEQDKKPFDLESRDGPKSIVLFSDGTGNSSGKLFKTNVWRMYEAVDLGPPQDGRKQIAFYDDGVGTSSFKPLALLGGIFGVGLKRNVLDIYRYACRNYQPSPGEKPGEPAPEDGDHIYGFGFSRGAFTMRVAIAMIAKVGLVTSSSEAELDQRSKQAWRAYRSRFVPRSKWVASLWRLIGGRGTDHLIELERARNYHPVIKFVGVWDTVAAYGGPISEITAAIDNWIYPLSMPNFKLPDEVRCARQALALDDERASFFPLPWDEIHEEDRIKELDDAPGERKCPWINKDRLEQVWFTGMHADVGGGYPDESLSYVSFLWMMEEAIKAGLRPVEVILQRFNALASSAGPIHNSRSGVGSYYRYLPRNIGIWLEPTDPKLEARRHPDRTRGLLRTVKIHESVALRICSGTDRYSPIGLPAKIRVVPPQAMGENAPPPTEQRNSSAEAMPPVRPLISERLRKRFEHPVLNKRRIEQTRTVWSLVGKRRRRYFASVFVTLALVLMPVWDGWLGAAPVLGSGHGLIGRVTALIGSFLPGFLESIVESWAHNPLYFLLLVAALVWLNRSASNIEQALRQQTYKAWQDLLKASDVEAIGAAARGETELEEKAAVPLSARLHQLWRWKIAPFLVLLVMIALAFWAALAVLTRVNLAYQERFTLCPAPDARPEETVRSTFSFETRAPCTPAGMLVEVGSHYTVAMEVQQDWRDGGLPTDPRGLTASEVGFAGVAGIPFRRDVGASYLQPIAHISDAGTGVTLQPITFQRSGTGPTTWRGEFAARRSGTLSLFANEAMPIGLGTMFYTDEKYGNTGDARVTIVKSDVAAEVATRQSASD